MARYSLSRPAREDLSEIIAYIASDSVEAALPFSDRFEQTFVVLANNLRAGSVRPELATEIRSFPMGDYVIFYQISNGEITIVRIRHSARDILHEPEENLL